MKKYLVLGSLIVGPINNIYAAAAGAEDIVPGHIYAIRSVSSGQYLNGRTPHYIDPLVTYREADIALAMFYQWEVSKADGNYTIRSISGGGYLDGRGPDMRDPKLAHRGPFGDECLQWEISKVDGKYAIKSVSGGGYLDGRASSIIEPWLAYRSPVGDKCLQWEFIFEYATDMAKDFAALQARARTAEASVGTLSAGMESLQTELTIAQAEAAQANRGRIAAETREEELRRALAAAEGRAARAEAGEEAARRENEERRRAATHRARSSSPFAARTEGDAARSTSRLRPAQGESDAGVTGARGRGGAGGLGAPNHPEGLS